MSPAEYVAALQRSLESHPHIASFRLNADHRGESFLYLHGRVNLVGGGVLDFKEFLAFGGSSVEKYMYAYNFRQDDQVIFRYDNAPDPRAQPLSSYPAHKHEHDRILPSSPVTLMDAVNEAMGYTKPPV